MTSSTAFVPTTNGSRYLQQLCKHWGHRLEVSFTPEEGKVNFPNAIATMTAHPATLEVRVEAAGREIIDQMKQVVASHLDRFAFREAPLTFEWRDSGESA